MESRTNSAVSEPGRSLATVGRGRLGPSARPSAFGHLRLKLRESRRSLARGPPRAAELGVLHARRSTFDPVLVVALALVSASLALSAPWVTTLAVGASLVLLGFTGARVLSVVSAFVFAWGAFRAHRAVGHYEAARDHVVFAGPWPERCSARGTIARSPVQVGGALRIDLDAFEVRCVEREPLRGRVRLYVPIEESSPMAPWDLARGDAVESVATLAPPSRFFNDGLSDPRPSAARGGIVLSGGAEDLVRTQQAWGAAAFIDRARAHVRQRITRTFSPSVAPMARALMLGEEDLEPSDQDAFRRSGLAHLLAVSGMHLVLVVRGAVGALAALLKRIVSLSERVSVERLASAIGLPLAWGYAAFAGASGSAVRAAWMCSVVLFADALGRRSSAVRAFGLSLLVMGAADPLVAYDLSFVLSALATGGLLGLARPVADALERILPSGLPLRGKILAPMATTLAATMSCAPVLTTLAPELPVGGLVANLVAVPLGEAAALPLCLAHAVLTWWPAAEAGAAAAASGALSLVREIAKVFARGSLPALTPTPEQLAVLCVSAVAVALFGRVRVWGSMGACAVALLEVAARIQGAPRGMLRVTFLDVGQGDAALVDLPDGSCVLIDGGGLVGSPLDVGERIVAPLLAVRRRRALRAVVLSHPHPDHYLGLAAVLLKVPTGALWDTGQGEAEGLGRSYGALLSQARARAVPVMRPRELCGTHELGGAHVDVLAPCPDTSPDLGPNDNSFVLRVRYGDRAVLFMGDAERAEEAHLVREHAPQGRLLADVLKVGHHGSRTSSSPSLLGAVKPSLAVISCGVRNRFGHPHPATLDSLEIHQVRALRTDRDGSIVVTTDGHSLEVRTLRPAL